MRDGAGGVGRWVLRNILMDTGGTEEGNGRMAQSQWRIERGKKRRDTRKGKPRMSRSVSVAVPRESSARRVGGNRRRRMDCPRITLSPLPSSGAGRRSGGDAQPAERTWRSEGPKTASSSSTWRWNSCLMSWHGAPWRVWRGFPWKRFVPFARLQIRRQGVVSSA